MISVLVAELVRDHGALINVDAPGCGTSVVRGQMGHKQEAFHRGVKL